MPPLRHRVWPSEPAPVDTMEILAAERERKSCDRAGGCVAIKRYSLASRRKSLGFSQEKLAEQLGVDRSTIVRWESGTAEPQPALRSKLAHSLQLSMAELAELMSESTAPRRGEPPAQRVRDASRPLAPQGMAETDDMNRREMLRLMSMAGTLIAASELRARLDLDRLEHAVGSPRRLSTRTLDEYEALNGHLWHAFTLSSNKAAALPMVRGQLDVLIVAMQEVQGSGPHQRLCALAADLFQLAGEIMFDGNQYTSAAHCYTLAAQAAKEANALDLWACALTRHAFISVYEQRFERAAPMLELAQWLACGGDSLLSTRHWVSAVQAEVFAGLGDLKSCEVALDRATDVGILGDDSQNGGWLRFDGSRLAEERGTCYVTLRRPVLADAALSEALQQTLSSRRRGGVLVDLASLAIQQHDYEQLLSTSNSALDLARQTGSGFVAKKLQGLAPDLELHVKDPRIRQLSNDIKTLSGADN